VLFFLNELLNEFNIKLVVLGNGGVGKTSLINSITGTEVSERYIPTIGSNILKKDYLLDEQNALISISLWELGGQRAFNPLNPVFFTNVDIAFIVFDLSKPDETIVDINNVYLNNLMEKSGESIIFIIGNKIDLDLNENKLKELLQKENLDDYPIVCVSALTNKNIENLIDFAIYNFLKEKKEEFKENDIEDLSKPFLDKINKTVDNLNKILINLDKINSLKFQKKPSLKVKKKKIDIEEDSTESKSAFIQENKEDLDLIKKLIKSTFNQNILSVEYMITNLKKTPIQLLEKSIDKTLNELRILKDDFELKLNSLINFDNISIKKSDNKVKENLLKGE